MRASLATLILLLAACGEGAKAALPTAEAAPAVGVRVETPKDQPGAAVVRATGILRAKHDAVLSAPATGTLARVYANVGTAGNLTEAGVNGQIDWSMIQNAGGADRGIESAVAVLIDQLGVFSCVYFVVLGAAWYRLAAGAPTRLHLVLCAAGLGLAANGVLQEEALFSPASAGLLFLLIGLVNQTSTPGDGVVHASGEKVELPAFQRARG